MVILKNTITIFLLFLIAVLTIGLEAYKYPGFFQANLHISSQFILALTLSTSVLLAYFTTSITLKSVTFFLILCLRVLLLSLYLLNQSLIQTSGHDEIFYLSYHIDSQVIYQSLQIVTVIYIPSLLLISFFIIKALEFISIQLLVLSTRLLRVITIILRLENHDSVLRLSAPFLNSVLIGALIFILYIYLPSFRLPEVKIVLELIFAYIILNLFLIYKLNQSKLNKLVLATFLLALIITRPLNYYYPMPIVLSLTLLTLFTITLVYHLFDSIEN